MLHVVLTYKVQKVWTFSTMDHCLPTKTRLICCYLNGEIMEGKKKGEAQTWLSILTAFIPFIPFIFGWKFTLEQNFNDTHREKLCFTQFSTRTTAWLLLTLFVCLQNQLRSIYSIIAYWSIKMFEKSDSSKRK